MLQVVISKQLGKLLEQQVANELQAHNLYLGIAIWFGQQSLDKWADFFYKQAEEEREHAMKIVHFLVDVGYEFHLGPISAVKASFKDAVAAVNAASKNEQTVTGQFKQMAEVALKNKDYVGFQFLQWFLEEQVEEEALMQKLLDILAQQPNPREAELHLERGEH